MSDTTDKARQIIERIVGAWDCLMRTDGAEHPMGCSGTFTAAHWANGNGMAAAIDEAKEYLGEHRADCACWDCQYQREIRGAM